MTHRRLSTLPRWVVPMMFFICLLSLSARVSALDVAPMDLTGVWQAENGVRYLLRQLGSDLFWSMDDLPRVNNVFVGRIEGSTITGRWVDLPGGQLLNSGTLTLRVESPDRLVKVSAGIPYGNSVWTRVRTGSGPLPAPPSAGTPATWTTQADSWRGQNGRRETLMCPPGGPTSGRLWGTDIYTDDSSICLAAVHAGLITAAGGGTVTIEIRPGQSAYTGSMRYGVTSQGYGGWSGSFIFAAAAPPATSVPPPPTAQPVPPTAAPPSSGSPPPAGAANWGTQADQWRGQHGQRKTLACPSGGPTAGRLWGTDVYTDDSSICLAAVHSGLITASAGGTVTIEIRPGQSTYTGSTRYGVTSQGWGSWHGSFVFVGALPGGGPSGPAARGICDDPKTLATMDEWLGGAIPPQREGEFLRYEAWGRLVGRSQSATITAPSPPDTRLSRCEYLWEHAAELRSTNLGTLNDYVNARSTQR